MSGGSPLTDADRWDWLVLVREKALSTLEALSSTADMSGSAVVVTCSALKRKYRDVLRIASYQDPSVRVHFLFLNVSEDSLLDRVLARQNHYMKDSMVATQLQCLEVPQNDEFDVFSVDASGTSEEVSRVALDVVKRVLEPNTEA